MQLDKFTQTQGKIDLVIADGAYDPQDSRAEIKKKKAKALIPPLKNARLHHKDSEQAKKQSRYGEN